MTTLPRALTNELVDRIRNAIDEQFDEDTTEFTELHNTAFNQDYYIIGTWNAKQWLITHDIDVLEAIEIITDYEDENFGESNFVHDGLNYERIVNMLTYIYGEQIISKLFDWDGLEDTDKETLLAIIDNSGE